jgi:hypothetical protein
MSFPTEAAKVAADLEVVVLGAAEVVEATLIAVEEATEVVGTDVVEATAVKFAISKVPHLARMVVLQVSCPVASSGWAVMQSANDFWQMLVGRVSL